VIPAGRSDSNRRAAASLSSSVRGFAFLHGSWKGDRPALPDIAPSTRGTLRPVLICRRTECLFAIAAREMHLTKPDGHTYTRKKRTQGGGK